MGAFNAVHAGCCTTWSCPHWLSFDRLREACDLVEDPSRPPTVFGEIGQDEGFSKVEANLRVTALMCYFISQNRGDAAGTGVASCHSGVKISSQLDNYMQSPTALTGWKKCFPEYVRVHYWVSAPRQVLLQWWEISYTSNANPGLLGRRKMLSADSDFGTHETWEGDHLLHHIIDVRCARFKWAWGHRQWTRTIRRTWQLVVGTVRAIEASLEARYSMLGSELEYDFEESCCVISVLY